MKPSIEQIQAILSENTFQWAINQLQSGESINEKCFSDFISVSQDEIEIYVKQHGFPRNAVEIVNQGQRVSVDDRTCIVELASGWEIFYIERGQKSQQALVSSLDEARQEVIRRMITAAKIALNHRYRHAHPELNLPRPSEMG